MLTKTQIPLSIGNSFGKPPKKMIKQETKSKAKAKTDADPKPEHVIVKIIKIRPIMVEPLTKRDLDSGMTTKASAVITIGKDSYDFPKEGGRVELKKPFTLKELSDLKFRTDVKLYMYDRQPSDDDDYPFTVNFPMAPDLVVRNNEVDLVFLQHSPRIVFSMTDGPKFVEFLLKEHSEDEIENLVPWWRGYLKNKEEILKEILD